MSRPSIFGPKDKTTLCTIIVRILLEKNVIAKQANSLDFPNTLDKYNLGLSILRIESI